jgi:hypothetical protein
MKNTKQYSYEEYSNKEMYLNCPYCDAELDYCTADGLPDGEFIQCNECNNWASISAEFSIDWTVWTLASIELLEDIGDYKKGDILHTNCQYNDGTLNSQYSLVNGEWTDINQNKRFYQVLELNESYIETRHFKWLGFCNDVDNDQKELS